MIVAMTVVATSLQVNLLGIEAYGIVGFITTLQIAFSVLDLGLSNTITREVAADRSNGRASSVSLLQTAHIIFWSASLIMGGVLWLAAPTLTQDWFQKSSMPRSEIVDSLRLIAIYLALRWPVALYVGLLGGLQKLTAVNVVKVSTSFLRLFGGIIIVLIYRDLKFFLIWYVISALIEVCVYFEAARRSAPKNSMMPRIDLSVIQKVWRFSLTMNALALIGIIVVQVDRIAISSQLTLTDLGAYSVAYMVASTIALLVAAISGAAMPSIAALDLGDRQAVVRRYRLVDRVIMFLVTGASAALLFNAETLLRFWLNRATADLAASTLQILVVGFWVSATIATIYTLAVALRTPRYHMWVNALAAAPYVAVMFVSVYNFGIEGAAFSWLGINVFYAVVIVPVLLPRLTGITVHEWFVNTVISFALLGIVCFGIPVAVIGIVAPLSGLAGTMISLAVGAAVYVLAANRLFGSPLAEVLSRLRATIH